MTCPVCGCDTIVIDTRQQPDMVRRRRKCLECDYRFNTVEVDMAAPKRDDLLAKKIKAAAGPLATRLREIAAQLQELETMEG